MKIFLLRYKVVYKTKLKRGEVYIVTPNHVWEFDPFLVGAVITAKTGKMVRWFCKKELLDYREIKEEQWSKLIKNKFLCSFVSWFTVFCVSRCGVIPVDRNNGKSRLNGKAIVKGKELLLKCESSIGVFIEGGIGRSGPASGSATLLAWRSRKNVLPVKILKKERVIIVGEPYFPNPNADRNEEAQKLLDIINNL